MRNWSKCIQLMVLGTISFSSLCLAMAFLLDLYPLLWLAASISLSVLVTVKAGDLLSELLNCNSKKTDHWILSYLHEYLKKLLHKESKAECDNSSSCDVTSELILLAQCLHSKLIFPWYSRLSPDGQAHQQLSDLLEEIVLSCWQNFHQSGGLHSVAVDCTESFAHILQRKTEGDINGDNCDNEGNVVTNAERDELNGLIQLALLSHLPASSTCCGFITFLIRDILSANLLVPLYTKLSDPSFLYQKIRYLIHNSNDIPMNSLQLITKNSESVVQCQPSTSQKVRDFTYSPERKSSEVKKRRIVKKSVPVALSDSVLPSTVHIVKPIPLKVKQSFKKSDGGNQLSRKWSKRPFLRGIVDGINEEEYLMSNVGIGINTLPEKVSSHAKSRSRPSSPRARVARVRQEGVASELHRSRSLSNIVPSPELADEATNSFIARECHPSPTEKVGKARRKDRYLLKMDSFDKFDSASEFPMSPISSRQSISKSKSATENLNELARNFSTPKDKRESSESVFYVPHPETEMALSNKDEAVNFSLKESVFNCSSSNKPANDNDVENTNDSENPENGIPSESSQMVAEEITKSSVTVPGLEVLVDSLPDSASEEQSILPHSSKDHKKTCSPKEASSPTSSSQMDNSTEELSPIYEESNTLESSIAKLRSLLSERDSQHSLGSLSSIGSSDSEREPRSAKSDPGRYLMQDSSKFSFFSSSNKNFSSVNEDSAAKGMPKNAFSDDSEVLEAADVPLDGRIFVKCSVTGTEPKVDPQGDHYTGYFIQYDAIYISEELEKTLEKKKGRLEDELGQSDGAHMVLHTNIVSRRFREFIALHSTLSSHPLLRHSIKGIQGPNKWRPLPLNKLDSSTVSSRRKNLEEYLQSLLGRLEINCSAIMRDFLAYSSEESVTFVRKTLSLSSQRLSRLLGRTMSGVFKSLRPTLPIAEGEVCNYSSEEPSIATKVPKSSLRKNSNQLLPVPDGKSSDSRPASPGEKRSQYSENYQEYDMFIAITGEVQQSCPMEEALFRSLQVSDDSPPSAFPYSNHTSFDSCDFERSTPSPLPKSGENYEGTIKKMSKTKAESKENLQTKSRFFVASNFVDDFFENAKRRVNANLGVSSSVNEMKLRSVNEDTQHTDDISEKQGNVRQRITSSGKDVKSDTYLRVETDGVDGIFSKGIVKGVYSKVKSSSLLSGSQSKMSAKDDKVDTIVSKGPIIVYSNATTPSFALPPYKHRQIDSKAYKCEVCLRCHGSTVPPITLPRFQEKSVSVVTYGSALLDLFIEILRADESLVSFKESITDLVSLVLVPPINSCVTQLLDESMKDVNVSTYIKQARLKVLEMNFFGTTFSNKKLSQNKELNRLKDRFEETNNEQGQEPSFVEPINEDTIEELNNLLISKLPPNFLVGALGRKVLKNVSGCLRDPKLCRMFAMSVIKVVFAHILPPQQR